MPDFVNVIFSAPGTIGEEDARVLRAALATGGFANRIPPRGASGLRAVALLLRQACRDKHETKMIISHDVPERMRRFS